MIILVVKHKSWRGGFNGGYNMGDLPPQAVVLLATVQKWLALDFVACIVSLLHIIWYTFWSLGK